MSQRTAPRRAAERTGFISLLVLAAHVAVAQTEPAACASASQSVHNGASRRGDLEQLAACPVTGPDAVGAVWKNGSSLPGSELTTLINSSRRIRDGRLYATVFAVAADGGRSPQLRLAALSVLAAYYRPDMAPSLGWLRSAPIGEPVPSVTDAYAGNGSVALPDSRKTEFPALLARLAQGDPDSDVAKAALRVRQYIALTDPDQTPVPVNAVRLVAACGNLLELQSTIDVTIPLRVSVLGTSTTHTYTLKRWTGGAPIQLTLDLPPGTVVVTYGSGHEVARLTSRNGPCSRPS